MEIVQPQATIKLPAKMFTGDAWANVVYRGEDPSRARANMVRFSPGAPAETRTGRPGSSSQTRRAYRTAGSTPA
jgi:hypothetical protein